MLTGAIFSHHASGGAIFIDFSHDGDMYFFGRCSDCVWRDLMDHHSMHVAEDVLADHASKEHS